MSVCGLSARRTLGKQPDSFADRWAFAFHYAADAAFRVHRVAGQKTLRTAIEINAVGVAAALSSANRLCAESVFHRDSIGFFAFCTQAS